MSNIITHQLDVYSPVGNFLTSITDKKFVNFSYGLMENEPGVLELTLPGDFDLDFLPIDGIIEIYRSYADAPLALEGATGWFIRLVFADTLDDGTKVIRIVAYSACHILARRIVAYSAGASYTEKVSIAWDEMLREIVRENYSTSALDPARDLSPWLTVPVHPAIGSTITRSMAWDVVLNVLQKIVQEVKETGYYCAFDIVRVNPALFEFQVFYGSRGNNHSASSGDGLIFSEASLSLLTPQLEYNWTAEHNFIYAGGQGQESERLIVTAQDNTRIGISPFNRQEFMRDARQAETSAALLAEANTALEANRPRRIFTGKISQTENHLYGVHWKWGDIVVAQHMGLSLDCHINAITVSVERNGTEVVQGYLRSESDV